MRSDAPQDSGRSALASLVRWLFAALAYVCVALALVGVVLPGLPTVPFVLVAAWAAARGSRRLDRWLRTHPQFESLLADWREQRAIPTRAKWLAVVLLALSWVVLAARSAGPWVLGATALLFMGLAWYLLSRPPPRTSVRS